MAQAKKQKQKQKQTQKKTSPKATSSASSKSKSAAKRPKAVPIETRIIPSVERDPMSPGRVEREFRRLIEDGAILRVAGKARRRPMRLFALGHTPKHKIELFGTRFYLANARQNPELRFMVAYVVQENARTGRTEIFPRIFYKDLSLVWRSASHFSDVDGLWVGKGDTFLRIEDGHEIEESRESTTDLPIEMQSAVESLLRWTRRVRGDGAVLAEVLHDAPEDRIRPYVDFTRPRERAAADRRNLIHGGRSIARFTRRNDPTSLRFVAGFEPDFRNGILETTSSRSRLYGGALERYRILSTNRKIQYGFLAGPRHVWIIPPQATTTELSSYGLRTIDVHADDDLFIPGFEYHYFDDDVLGEDGQPELYSQIPEGFAGDPCEHDDAKADASPWLDQIPVIREFRRKVLGQRLSR